ncbi:MAG: 5,10-methylenetetrahydromethanopterin reductase [Pseudonocardiales bacterium]|jgi:hypothetical protein|nr:5,10-methylenetetrahydromethanopterin reductase [Pseudonocardiales bacterium]
MRLLEYADILCGQVLPGGRRDRTADACQPHRPRGGRTPHEAVRVVASLPVSVTDDVDSARAHAAQQFAVYGRLPSYRAMLDREGYPGPQDAALIGDENIVTNASTNSATPAATNS